MARAEGYADAKQLFSTVNSGTVNVVMNKLYETNINLKLDGVSYGGEAIISFDSDENSQTVVYPEQKSVELVEGQYEITVYVYKDSELKFPASTQQQCTEVPRGGIFGMMGLTEQKCFDINIPEQVISNVLAGGGRQNHYILEAELQSSSTIEINADGFTLPKTMEQLQNNYFLFESKGLGVSLR